MSKAKQSTIVREFLFMRRILLLLIIFSRLGLAFEFSHFDARKLASMIKTSLDSQNPEHFVFAIKDFYAQLPRHEIPVQELLELRFQMQNWRLQVARSCLAKNIETRAQYDEIASLLLHLEYKFSVQQLQELFAKRIETKSDASQRTQDNFYRELLLVGTQAYPVSLFESLTGLNTKLSGPLTELPIPPLKSSAWPFAKWRYLKDQSRYEIRDNSVHFREHELQSGDFFLGDLAVDTAAFLAVLSKGEMYNPHLGIFVVLEGIPLVLEIFGHGLRAVPLQVYFSSSFSGYIEIYRLKQAPHDWNISLQKAAKKFLAMNFAYDFSGISKEEKHQTCASFGNLMLKETGNNDVCLRSDYNQNVFNALKELQINLNDFFVASNFAGDERFFYIGTVDNNNFMHAIALQVSVNYLAEFLKDHKLKTELLPKEFHDKESKISTIQKWGWFGDLLMQVLMGYSLPLGSSKLLAFTPVFDDAFIDSIAQVKPHIENLLDSQKEFSIHDFQDNEEVKRILTKASQAYRHWFYQ